MNGYSGTSWLTGGQYDGTKDFLSGFNGAGGYGADNRDLNAGRSGAFYNLLQSGGAMDPRYWYNEANKLGSQSDDVYGKLTRLQNRTGADKVASFLDAIPGLEEYASRAATGAMSEGGVDYKDMARAESSRARRSTEGRLASSGALGSGGAGGMIADAASQPLLNAVQMLAQMKSAAYSNALQPMASSAYGAELGRGSEMAQLLQLLGQRQGQTLSAGQGLAGLLSDQSQQVLLAPDMRQRTGMLEQLGNAGVQAGMMALTGGLSGIPALAGGAVGSGLMSLFARPQQGLDPNYLAAYGGASMGGNKGYLYPDSNSSPWTFFQGPNQNSVYQRGY